MHRTAFSVQISIEKRWKGSGTSRFAEIIPESPLTLLEEPAQVGEYLVEIDGVTLNQGVNLPEQLQRKRGKRVTVKLNDKPQLEGARELTVQPIDSGQHRHLRYKEWVRWNETYIHEKSDGEAWICPHP